MLASGEWAHLPGLPQQVQESLGQGLGPRQEGWYLLLQVLMEPLGLGGWGPICTDV